MSSCSTKNINKKASASIGGVAGGKTARACDGCVKRRARWYCSADDAFLCQPCDNSVHSANSLARRHERVRLKTSSSASPPSSSLPAWHRGFTRKPRTPRNKHVPAARDPSLPLVPEIFTDAKTTSHDDDDDDVDDDDDSLLYRVPIFDPLVAELCNNNNNGTFNDGDAILVGNNNNNNSSSISSGAAAEMSARPFLPTETDLAEFAADVESLLGCGLETECDFGIEGLGFVDHRAEKEYTFDDDGRVKIELHCEEQEEEDAEDRDVADTKMCWSEASAEPLVLSFEDYEDSPAAAQPKKEPSELEETGLVIMNKKSNKLLSGKKKNKKKKILLRLDYDRVITAWAGQGSPWTTGDRPDLDPEAAGWPDHDSAGAYTAHQLHHHHFMDPSGVGGTPAILADGGREARVSRYREKRRTRLFSKKIRYEVRKLNAEKRPRMKGRFVKRASFVGPHFPVLK